MLAQLALFLKLLRPSKDLIKTALSWLAANWIMWRWGPLVRRIPHLQDTLQCHEGVYFQVTSTCMTGPQISHETIEM